MQPGLARRAAPLLLLLLLRQLRGNARAGEEQLEHEEHLQEEGEGLQEE